MDMSLDFISVILSWKHRCYSLNGSVYDAIDIITTPNNIELSWSFKRHKSMVYNEYIKDNTFFHTKSLSFLQAETFLLHHVKSKQLK